MTQTTAYKQEEIREHAIGHLEYLKGSDVEASEVHHECFNNDYYIIGTYKAKQWLGDKVFDVIEVIKEYEQDNFGQVSTDLSDPEKVVNMYVYIVGEEILQESDTLRDKWDKKLDDSDIDVVIKELESK